MANEHHLSILKDGVTAWNEWRIHNPEVHPELSGADLSDAPLRGANFRHTNQTKVNLTGAFCPSADFFGADLKDAILIKSDLIRAELGSSNLRFADLSNSCLIGANLSFADLSHVNLSGGNLFKANLASAKFHGAVLNDANLSFTSLMDADLTCAQLQRTNLMVPHLLRTDLRGAVLSDCYVHGASVWKGKVDSKTIQTNLDITDPSEPTITTDDLEIAQFIYLLLNHEKLRNAIDSITKKGVLLLGRFGGGGLGVLQAIADELRRLRYIPIIFTFHRPENRNYTETVKTLVGISRFVMVDLSGPSVPQELYATIPHYKIPFVQIIGKGDKAYSMIKDILEFPWVIKQVVMFSSVADLIKLTSGKIVQRAERQISRRKRMLGSVYGPKIQQG